MATQISWQLFLIIYLQPKTNIRFTDVWNVHKLHVDCGWKLKKI